MIFAQEACDLFSLDREHCLAGELFVQGLEGRLGAKHQVHGVLHLHQTPVVGLPEDIEHRTEPLGVAVQAPVQFIGLDRIGERLRPPEVRNAHERVVGQAELYAGGRELSGEPRMAVAVELQPKRAPGGHPQVAKPQCLVDEVEVVVQALARTGLEAGLTGGLVMPGSVAIAAFHRRDHVHQPRIVASAREHLGHDVFLADVGLVDMLDLDAGLATCFQRPRTDTLTQRFGTARVVKDADPARVKKARHAARVAHPRQRAGNDDSVVARQYPCHAVPVTLREYQRHRRLPWSVPRATLTFLVPAMPA